MSIVCKLHSSVLLFFVYEKTPRKCIGSSVKISLPCKFLIYFNNIWIHGNCTARIATLVNNASRGTRDCTALWGETGGRATDVILFQAERHENRLLYPYWPRVGRQYLVIRSGRRNISQMLLPVVTIQTSLQYRQQGYNSHSTARQYFHSLQRKVVFNVCCDEHKK